MNGKRYKIHAAHIHSAEYWVWLEDLLNREQPHDYRVVIAQPQVLIVVFEFITPTSKAKK